MNRCLPVLTALGLSGCVYLDDFVGSDTDAVIAHMGQPTRTFELLDGGQELEYDTRTTAPSYTYTPTTQSPAVQRARTRYGTCTTIFTTDADRIVTAWRREGEYCY